MNKLSTFIHTYKRPRRIFSIGIPVILALFVTFTLFGSYVVHLVHASFGSWADTSLINACVDSRGRPIIVSAGTNCNANETQTTWLKDVDAGSGLSLTRSSSGVTLSVSGLTSAQQGTVTKIITANLMGWNSETTMAPGYGVRMMSTGATTVVYTFAIPYDYQGGNITVREWYLVNDANGTAKLTRDTTKASSSGTESSVESGTADDLTVSTGGSGYRTYTISSTNVSAGDIFWVALNRNGNDAADTMGRLDLRAVAVEYTGTQ